VSLNKCPQRHNEVKNYALTMIDEAREATCDIKEARFRLSSKLDPGCAMHRFSNLCINMCPRGDRT
jgi:hypothetical protein